MKTCTIHTLPTGCIDHELATTLIGLNVTIRLELFEWTSDPTNGADAEYYFVANDERRRSLRTFAVHRVRTLTSTEERFARPAEFSLNAFLADSFRIIRGGELHEVRVRIGPTAAPFAEGRRWHTSQVAHRLPDGALELSFRVSSLEEVCAWLLGFRGEAQALAPEALRALMYSAGQHLVAAHGTGRADAEPLAHRTAARARSAILPARSKARPSGEDG